MEQLDRFDGPLNLARVLFREAGAGQLDEAVAALKRAARFEDPPAPPWTLNWLGGLINVQQGRLKEAEENFQAVLKTKIPQRNFDFSLDYVVINLLGETLFERAKQQRGKSREAARNALLQEAIEQFQKTLQIDSENVTAHYNLSLLYAQRGENEQADKHRRLHEIYKPDDTARGRAVGLARQKYPAANAAAEALVIYNLHRPGAPGLGGIVEAVSTVSRHQTGKPEEDNE